MPGHIINTTPWANPMGLNGFEFIEYAAPDPAALGALFEQMGFTAVAKHRSKAVTLYRQGDINFIINADPDSVAQSFTELREPAICAFALRVKDATAAFKQALALGAWEMPSQPGVMELRIPAIMGIGDSLIYLVDRYGERSIYDVDFLPEPGAEQNPRGVGLERIDHISHAVRHGCIQEWADFYGRLFNFRVSQAITDGQTGLGSLLMASPCGKIRIKLGECPADSTADPAVADEYNSDSIPHAALAVADIVAAVDALQQRGVVFRDKPAAEDKTPMHIFTKPAVGPIFFEIVQRPEQIAGEGRSGQSESR